MTAPPLALDRESGAGTHWEGIGVNVAGDGQFHLEPQSHVTPETVPILEVKVQLSLAMHRAVSCRHLGRGGGRGGGAPGAGDGPHEGSAPDST